MTDVVSADVSIIGSMSELNVWTFKKLTAFGSESQLLKYSPELHFKNGEVGGGLEVFAFHTT